MAFQAACTTKRQKVSVQRVASGSKPAHMLLCLDLFLYGKIMCAFTVNG